MTDTEREALTRRIDELCAEVEKYKSARDASVDLATKTIDRIRELEAEVEQLRKQLHDQQDTAEHNFVRNAREYKRVCDENDKLRKLAKQMHVCLTRPKVYDGEHPYLTATECPYFTEGDCDYSSCGFEHRMQALGIEVDNGTE